jgi:hypothetical protein
MAWRMISRLLIVRWNELGAWRTHGRWTMRAGRFNSSRGQFIPAQGVVEEEMHVTDDVGLARGA